MEKKKKLDLLIVGAGPAGLAASIYASRYSLKHVVAGDVFSSQISQTHHIDNYPGLEDMTGMEFSQKWVRHAEKYGAEIIPVMVSEIKKEDGGFLISFVNSQEMRAMAILLATGTKRKELNLTGEKKLFGKGVSYCATCDGFFYKNKTVGVIGGADSAASAAIYLADIAQKVYLIYRKNALRAEPYWVNLIKKNHKIEVIYNTNVTNIEGENRLERIELDNSFQEKNELMLDGLFIEAGSVPNIDYAKDLGIMTNESGYIKIQSNGATSVPGVFAAGDITNGSDKFCQVITAAAEGAIAARGIYNFLKNGQ
jgi:thioredoxin reductase (NADPH)